MHKGKLTNVNPPRITTEPFLPLGFSLKKGGLVRCKLNGNNQNLQVMYLLFLRWSSFRQKMKTRLMNHRKNKKR